MTLVVRKRNGNLVPSLVSDFFDTNRFFNRDLMDFDEDLLDTGSLVALPEANIIENGKDYKIELAAPGLEKKDFKIEVEDGVLSISAEKEEERKEERENYKRREFSYNSFTRSFILPENLIADKIDAKYDNGILRISLPKKELTISKPRKEIKVS